jgi:serine/threonine protein kinase
MFEPGDQLESPQTTYAVERKLGDGGFGHTFLARDSDGAEVALKVLRIERLESWKALELFGREAAALRSLAHPTIPSYIEFFATTEQGPIPLVETLVHHIDLERLVLVQSFRAGRSLRDRLQAGDRLSPDTLLHIAETLLETLKTLHAQSPPIIHRDLTPANIILDDDGTVSLVDFGAISQGVTTATLGGSTSVGTLGYIPIEQSLGKAKPASDLYALGVTLTVMASGVAPEELPLDDATSKIDLEPLGLHEQLPPKLVALIDRMIEPLQANRPATAGEALHALQTGAAVAKPVNPKTPTIAETPTIPTWKKTLFVLALGGSVGSALIIYPLNFNNFSETEMIRMSPFWVLPAAFGLFGLMLQKSKRPLLYAAASTIGAALALAFFFAAIFPAL